MLKVTLSNQIMIAKRTWIKNVAEIIDKCGRPRITYQFAPEFAEIFHFRFCVEHFRCAYNFHRDHDYEMSSISAPRKGNAYRITYATVLNVKKR